MSEQQQSALEQMRAAIFNAPDITVERVEVPEWALPFPLFVKALTGRDREKYLESIRKIVGKGKHKDIQILTVDSSAKLAARTMCLEDGTLIFTDQDVDALSKKSAKALERVINAASKLNGFNEDEDEAKNASAATTESGADSSTV